MKNYLVILALAMVATACGGSESSDPVDTTTGAGAAPTTVAAGSEGTLPPTTQDSESDNPPANQPGGIVLTIGDQTWEFETAQCAFYNAEPGSDGSEWNVSNIKDGLQVYVNVDSFETSVTIADIANGGSPTLSWAAVDDAVTLTVNGDEIVAAGTFTDEVGGSGPTEGTLQAECASWFEG